MRRNLRCQNVVKVRLGDNSLTISNIGSKNTIGKIYFFGFPLIGSGYAQLKFDQTDASINFDLEATLYWPNTTR